MEIVGFAKIAIPILVVAFFSSLIPRKLHERQKFIKDANDLINPIRHELLGTRNCPNSNIKGAWEITFTLIREKLPFWKRKGFDRVVENYKKSKGADNQERDPMGGFSYKDTAKITHAVDELLAFLKPR
ncbi:MAG: hypothetical protein MUO68_01575 [Desulfobacteraceae bacterium]|nr:hypothetical protein [Desulfobacteraceae bacterium]